MMIDIVKTAFDVTLYKPSNAGKFLFSGIKGGMTASLRTKSVGVFGKYRLIY